MATVNEKMTAIADAIRDKTGGTQPLGLDDMAEKIRSGFGAGVSEGEMNVFNLMRSKDGEGKVLLPCMFYLWEWEYMKLPCKFISRSGTGLHHTFYQNTKLKKIESKYIQGDGINGFNDNSYFASGCSSLMEVEDINFSYGSYNSAFYYCSSLLKIAKINSCENSSYGAAFSGCNKLSYIRFDGVIGTALNFKDSPLDIESTKSIITHLKNYTDISTYEAVLTIKSSCIKALEKAGFTEEDKIWLEENGITYSDDLTWVEVIDNFKWNLVLA